MSNDHVRKSISATLTEIEATELALGLPPDSRPWSFYEAADALEIIDRIERRWKANQPTKPITKEDIETLFRNSEGPETAEGR